VQQHRVQLVPLVLVQVQVQLRQLALVPAAS
jgi:hypothetical protein